MDELAQDKDILEVSWILVEVLYAFLQFESSKFGPKKLLVNRGLFARVRFSTCLE